MGAWALATIRDLSRYALMSMLISLIVVLAIIGIAWWAITQIPMPQPIRIVAVVIIALVAIVFLLQFVGGGHVLLH